MNVVTKRWMPVLKKCHEYQEDLHEPMAQLLENQYLKWTSSNSSLDNIADFTRFVLPLVRKTFKKLHDCGFEINVLESDEGTVNKVVAVVNGLKLLERVKIFRLGIDREAEMTDAISEQMVSNLLEKFPEKKLNLFLLIVPNPEPPIEKAVSDIMEELKDGDKALTMCIKEQVCTPLGVSE